MTKTTALLENLIILPSNLRIGPLTLTITALYTLPFVTRPLGAATLADTTITSPTVADFLPPKNPIHRTLRAPELSATSKMAFFCIILKPTHQLQSTF
ncbi:50S ribosomal protein L14 [Anaplasma phagocytophilum str. HGE1]|nr:50S ribosomal protein L14 [Anaplasma phagocytophilum str. HGE1]